LTNVPVSDFEIWRAAQHTRMRWANGGGRTTEIIAEPSREQWEWRLSVAEVDTAGPFSTFPGVDRSIALLTGKGFALTVGDRDEHVIDIPFQSFDFAGDEATSCRLIDGPVQDLNLMTTRLSVARSLDFIHITPRSERELCGVDLVVVVAGRVQIGHHELGYLDAIRPASPTRPIEIGSLAEAVVLATATADDHR
jgi:environmental stress-induced protein Ves